MKPQATKYYSTFGTVIHFEQPSPGWVKIGRQLLSHGQDLEPVYEWLHLRTPDLIELAACAQDAADEEWAVKESGEYGGKPFAARRSWPEQWWWAWIAVRRFYLSLRGIELIAYADSTTRWTLVYNKDDEESRRLGQQMIYDSPVSPYQNER